jgi:DtxR family Mn-dependent transcriptional regulator
VADRSLADCSAGQSFHLTRVTDQSPDFLRFLSQEGLQIGAKGVLVSNEPAQEDVTIRLAGQNKTLSREAAGKLMVC